MTTPKFHTTFRKKPDGSIELLETSICRMDDPDFRIEEADGSILYRISGTINFGNPDQCGNPICHHPASSHGRNGCYMCPCLTPRPKEH